MIHNLKKIEKQLKQKVSLFSFVDLKPIFHCDARLLALGTFASPNAKNTTFALLNAKNTNMLVSLALGDANISRFTRRVLPDAFYPTRFTRRQSVEYRWRWAFWRWGWRWACTFHIFCVDFICVWCPTRTPFPVEYGLKAFFPISHTLKSDISKSIIENTQINN